MPAILFNLQFVKSPGAETGIFLEIKVNGIAAHTLAPCLGRSSAALVIDHVW